MSELSFSCNGSIIHKNCPTYYIKFDANNNQYFFLPNIIVSELCIIFFRNTFSTICVEEKTSYYWNYRIKILEIQIFFFTGTSSVRKIYSCFFVPFCLNKIQRLCYLHHVYTERKKNNIDKECRVYSKHLFLNFCVFTDTNLPGIFKNSYLSLILIKIVTFKLLVFEGWQVSLNFFLTTAICRYIFPYTRQLKKLVRGEYQKRPRLQIRD